MKWSKQYFQILRTHGNIFQWDTAFNTLTQLNAPILAPVYAENGDFEKAISYAERALKNDLSKKERETVEKQLKSYRKGKAIYFDSLIFTPGIYRTVDAKMERQK